MTMSSIRGGASSDVMMQLGSFQFGVSTAAYQELTRRAGRRWAAIPRVGQLDALQDLGPESEQIELRGVVFPEYRAGTGQVQALRDLLDQAEPLQLVDGLGNVWGTYVIQAVDERQEAFAAAGVARVQEFTVSLLKYEESQDGGTFHTLEATTPVEADLSAYSSASSAGVDVRAIAEVLSTAAGGFRSSAAGISARLARSAAVLGGDAASALGAAARCGQVAQRMQTSAGIGLAAVNNAASLGKIRTACATMQSDARANANTAASASRVLESFRPTDAAAKAAIGDAASLASAITRANRNAISGTANVVRRIP